MPRQGSRHTSPVTSLDAPPIPPRHAISPARSYLQSRILTALGGLLLAVLALLTVFSRQAAMSSGPLLRASAIGMLLAGIVLLTRSATLPGALSGACVCLLLMVWAGAPGQASLGARAMVLHTGLTPLLVLFTCTFAATRAGRARKQRLRLAEAPHGRSASQVLANLAVAGVVVAASGLSSGGPGVPADVLCLAALVEATADTVSSEIGQAFGGQPRMILTLRRVAPGTDGAVTLVGTVAGLVSASLVSATGWWALRLDTPSTTVALLGGVAGLGFDSLLGATVERRGWLNNDLVNAASTLFAVATAALLLKLVGRSL